MSFLILLFAFICACSYEPKVASVNLKQDAYSYRFDLAKSYLVSGDFKRAKIETLNLLEIKKTPEAYNMLGLSLMGLGELKGAEEAFKKAVVLDPHYSPAWTNLSAYYLKVKRYSEAIEAAKKALSNPVYVNPERAYVNMADAFLALGRRQKALECLYKALRYNPSYAPAYERLLDYYISRGDISSARSVLFDARVSGVESPGVSFYHALLLIREGKLEDARRTLKDIIRDYPNTSWARKARIYLETIR